MIWDYSQTYANVHHWAWESILLMMRDYDKIKPGDTILVPSYPEYPVKMIERIFPEQKVEIFEVPLKPIHHSITKSDNSLFCTKEGQIKSIELCHKLMTFIRGKHYERPTIIIKVRLHNRRWMPLSNIQKLIDALYRDYDILVFTNPKFEKGNSVRDTATSADNVGLNIRPLDSTVYPMAELPPLTNCTVIENAGYEEQLEYSKYAYCSFHLGNGAGCIYAAIARIPMISVGPCLCLENDAITMGPMSMNPQIICLSDKKDMWGNGRYQWYDDIEKVTVLDVLKVFEKVRREIKKKYLIKGFEYLNSSAGTRAMHKLNAELLKRGYVSVIDKCRHGDIEHNQDILKAPPEPAPVEMGYRQRITRPCDVINALPNKGVVDAWKQNNKNVVVVWPELFMNTKMYQEQKSGNMVGWRLGDFGHFNRNEFKTVFYYSEMYKDCVDDKYRLYIPIIELELFNDNNLPNKINRLIWVGKGNREVGAKVKSKTGAIEITKGWPTSRVELAEVLKGCDILYTIDSNSAILAEARLCGAIVVYMNPENKPGDVRADTHLLNGIAGMDGIALNDSKEEIEKARRTLKDYKAKYLDYIKDWEYTVDEFIRLTQGVL